SSPPSDLTLLFCRGPSHFQITAPRKVSALRKASNKHKRCVNHSLRQHKTQRPDPMPKPFGQHHSSHQHDGITEHQRSRERQRERSSQSTQPVRPSYPPTRKTRIEIEIPSHKNGADSHDNHAENRYYSLGHLASFTSTTPYRKRSDACHRARLASDRIDIVLAAEQHLVVEVPSARTIVCPVLTASAHHPSVDPERLPWESSSAESQVLNKLNSSGVSVALAGFCGRANVAQPAGVLRNYLNYF